MECKSFLILSCCLLALTLGDCNWGLWRDSYPLITDSCYKCSGDCSDALFEGSIMVKCSSDNSSASLYSYNDTSCQYSWHEESLSHFECGYGSGAGSCDMTTLWIDEYNDKNTTNCSGDTPIYSMKLKLAPLDGYCLIDTDNDGYYLLINSNTSTLISYYMFALGKCKNIVSTSTVFEAKTECKDNSKQYTFSEYKTTLAPTTIPSEIPTAMPTNITMNPTQPESSASNNLGFNVACINFAVIIFCFVFA